MTDNSIYRDIAKRTSGDIYIGVVGPVRSGKSTFIHKFLESVVIPNIENEYDKLRTTDEAPQSASGKTIMTTEPKFIPDESVKISVDGDTVLNVKMIDCVGYLVDGALGGEEGGEARMVMTPWADEPIPFAKAAELGTGKVIGEHSTIGILVTTDGTITDIPRESYVPAEERVAKELKAQKKPFAIVLNSKNPESESARELAMALEEKYETPVALVNCTALNAGDIREILGLVLSEFPIRSLSFTLPEWCEALPKDHRLRGELIERIRSFCNRVNKFGDIERTLPEFSDISVSELFAGDGTGELTLPLSDEEYYKCLSELCGSEIKSEKDAFRLVCELSGIEKEYRKIESALREVEESGYGIVLPDPDEMELEEPTLAKEGGGYGVKISAKASSIHMIKTTIKSELCPVVGNMEQTEEVVRYLAGEFKEGRERVWECNMFGKSLSDLVKDGMAAKLSNIPTDARAKLGETLERVVNEGANGLICILL